MTGLPDASERAAFFLTARGKLISALVVAALGLGVVAEVISIVTGYHEMRIKAIQDRAKNTANFESLPEGSGVTIIERPPERPRPKNLQEWIERMKENDLTEKQIQHYATKFCREDHGDNSPLCKE